jgi:phosphoglycolate phosphatase/pyrophosphatase PpaX
MVLLRCLFVDHDDTAVDSTRWIHHPAHVAAMRELRPEATPVSFEDWMRANHFVGIGKFLRDEIGFEGAERAREIAVWRDWTERITPPFYPGILDTLREFRACGGYVVVCSHSEEAVIRRHYAAVGFPLDAVYAWTPHDPEKMKPSPYPVLDLCQRLGLAHAECAVLDDLAPGIEMAKRAGVLACAAGWAHAIPEIVQSMKAQADHYFETVADFKSFLLARSR